ncbi:hypothetical protein BDF19DRAFT_423696 [Syncephalis fuscata]|nr:hypothetical protein BDF19DRAFT_423696 [Syncephalis fuscata]
MSFFTQKHGIHTSRLWAVSPLRRLLLSYQCNSTPFRLSFSTSVVANSGVKRKALITNKPKLNPSAITEADRDILRQVLAIIRTEKPVTFYQRDGRQFSALIHAAAFFQLLLWLNGAWLAVDYLTVADKRNETAQQAETVASTSDLSLESDVTTSTTDANTTTAVTKDINTTTGQPSRVLAPLWQRAAVAIGLTVAGCGISASLLAYATRYVTRLQLTHRGDVFRVETAGLRLLSKPRELPVSRVIVRERVWTGQGNDGVTKTASSPFISLRVEGEYMGYIMDRNSGKFSYPQALDALIYRP